MIKTFKLKNRIVCYIVHYGNTWRVCTGKPSDRECLSWCYDNLPAAEATAVEYYNNYINI